MLTYHKLIRKKRRKEWHRIKEKFPKGKKYKKLKIYEKRKKKKSPIHYKLGFLELKENIDFEENIDNMIVLTSEINKYLKTSSSYRFSISHKQIKNISICGLVYLVGQISKVSKAKKISLKYNEELGLSKKEDKIRYLFYKIGYWDCFAIPKPYNVDKEIKDNYFLSIQTNTKSDILLLNKIKHFINDNVNFINNYSIEYRFDDAVKEAMANSVEHAYHENFFENGKEKGKWWICGHFDKITNTLELVFYDYGMGIRKSISRNLGEDAKLFFTDKIKDKIKTDADLIELALKSELTKYNNYKDHDRGKGFTRFKEFAKVSQNNCELIIVSDYGKYKYKFDGLTNIESYEKTKLKGKIEGMLIKWKIQLNPIGERNEEL